MKMFKKHHQRGVTLFEILLVLFIVAAITVTVAVGARRSTEATKHKQLLDDVTEVADNIRQLYSTKDNYAGLNANVIKNAKIAPDNMINDDGLLVHMFSTAPNTWWANTVNASEAFRLVFIQLTPAACTSLGTQALGFALKVELGNKAATTPTAIAAGCKANKRLKLTFD